MTRLRRCFRESRSWAQPIRCFCQRCPHSDVYQSEVQAVPERTRSLVGCVMFSWTTRPPAAVSNQVFASPPFPLITVITLTCSELHIWISSAPLCQFAATFKPSSPMYGCLAVADFFLFLFFLCGTACAFTIFSDCCWIPFWLVSCKVFAAHSSKPLVWELQRLDSW